MHRFLSGLLLFALPALVPPARAAAPDAPPALYSASLLQFINAYRSQHGLTPLETAKHLAALAREHSRYMAEHGNVSHDEFDQRFARAGSRNCVENVGRNHPDARAQFQGWQQSPGHNAAMLDPAVRRGGVAVVGSYVTFFACG